MTLTPDQIAEIDERIGRQRKELAALKSAATGGEMTDEKARLSTHGWQDTGDSLYVEVGDGAVMSMAIGELVWRLRYGDAEAARYIAASVIESYSYLVLECTRKEVGRRIKLMKEAWEKAHAVRAGGAP